MGSIQGWWQEISTCTCTCEVDRNFVGDERDDSGTIQRKDDDETRMPSLGETMSVSDEVSDREMIDSSILLAMMKNHTVI